MGRVYAQLTLEERRKIERWRHAKVSVNEMTRVLRRHRSTIFRELRRNHLQDPYMPKVALRPLRTSLEKDGRLNAMPRRCLGWKTPRRGVPGNMLEKRMRASYLEPTVKSRFEYRSPNFGIPAETMHMSAPQALPAAIKAVSPTPDTTAHRPDDGPRRDSGLPRPRRRSAGFLVPQNSTRCARARRRTV